MIDINRQKRFLFKKYLVVFLFFGTLGCSNAQSEIAIDAQSPQKFRLTDEEAGSIYAKVNKLSDESQLSFALIKNGEVRFYGIHRRNDSIFSIDNHENVFEIGSVSKVFTATLLADMTLEDKINLTDAINGYLDVSFKDDQKITFQSLSNHTSGLPRLPTNLVLDFIHRNNPYAQYDEVKLQTYLRDTMNLAEGTKIGEFEYSNLGAGLLGYTLSQIENKEYEQLLQERIAHKYGLTQTTTLKESVADVLVPGRNGGTIVPNWDLAILTGAGGIVSSVGDLSKFALAQFNENNTELKLTRSKTSDMNENTSIGLGWFIHTTKSGDTIYMHDGGTGGYTASILLDCKRKNGVIILSNISALGSGTQRVNQLTKELLNTLGDYN